MRWYVFILEFNEVYTRHGPFNTYKEAEDWSEGLDLDYYIDEEK